jgi:hypothetical protein
MYGIQVPFNGTTDLLNFMKNILIQKLLRRHTNIDYWTDGQTDSMVISYASASVSREKQVIKSCPATPCRL